MIKNRPPTHHPIAIDHFFQPDVKAEPSLRPTIFITKNHCSCYRKLCKDKFHSSSQLTDGTGTENSKMFITLQRTINQTLLDLSFGTFSNLNLSCKTELRFPKIKSETHVVTSHSSTPHVAFNQNQQKLSGSMSKHES